MHLCPACQAPTPGAFDSEQYEIDRTQGLCANCHAKPSEELEAEKRRADHLAHSRPTYRKRRAGRPRCAVMFLK